MFDFVFHIFAVTHLVKEQPVAVNTITLNRWLFQIREVAVHFRCNLKI